MQFTQFDVESLAASLHRMSLCRIATVTQTPKANGSHSRQRS